MATMLAGRATLARAVQPSNAELLMIVTPSGRVTLASFVQPLNISEGMAGIAAGQVMEVKPDPSKAPCPMLVSHHHWHSGYKTV
jgi:hypothetical protein